MTFEPSLPGSPTVTLIDSAKDLTGVACSSSIQCTAVDSSGYEVTFEPSLPGTPTVATIDGAVGLTGVACPAGGKYCTAVDSSGHEVTFEPSLPGTPTPATIDGAVGLTGVACPTEKQCTAVDLGGREVTFEPKSGITVPSSTTIGGGPTPSAAKSSISVTPIPTLLSGLAGSASFKVTVTLKDESGEPVPEDTVTLEVTAGIGSLREGIVDDPQETDSEGKATFDFTCPAGYCTAGDLLTVTATDEDGLPLGPVTDPVGEIQFAGNSYAGQTDTLEIEDLGGAETETGEEPVTLTLNGSPVVPFGPCATDSTGSLPRAGELGACTFTVPEIPFPKGQSPPASIPAVVSVGTREFDVTFPLQPTPSVQLSPTSGLERSVISVSGIGFARDRSVKVGFTPAGGSTPSASAGCQTNGDGEIINDEPIGDHYSCDLTVPADSPVGKGIVSVEGYATATAPFTVEAPTLVGIGIASNLAGNKGGAGGHLYVGEAATLEIEGHYNTGTIKSLEVPAGDVSWSPEPQPSGAIELNVVNGHTIGLTAKERTKSTGAGVVKVIYEGFEAKSEPIEVTHEPCKGCTFVNGALLNVKAEAPGSTPVAGAIANITQGVGGAPVFTLPPPCIPENGGCSSTYPDLEESATETCTTLGAGECQLIAGEGTIAVANEIEDTITLTAPKGYSVTGVSGCHEVTGPTEARVCHLKLGEYDPEQTIGFELEPWPVLTVEVGGPAGGEYAEGDVLNLMADGQEVSILPIDGTPGELSTCITKEAEDYLFIRPFQAGKSAFCVVQVPPGKYQVGIPPEWTGTDGSEVNAGVYPTGYIVSKEVTLSPAGNSTVTFSTSLRPNLTVEVGGPAGGEYAEGDVLNLMADGQEVTVLPIDGTPGEAHTCTTGGGKDYLALEKTFQAGQSAFCGVQVPAGSYQVSIPPEWTGSDGAEVNAGVYVTEELVRKDVTFQTGGSPTVTFSTSLLVNSTSGSSTGSSTEASVADGPLSAVASGGTGTVTVGQYGHNPEGTPSFGSSGKYIDVFLSTGNTFKEASFTDCDLNGGTGLYWWSPRAGAGHEGWEAVSDETPPFGGPPSGPCITVTINETTNPDLEEMAGTVFGVSLPPTSTPGSTTSLSPSSTTLPATTAATGRVSLDGSAIAVHSGGAAHVKLTCTGNSTCSGKLMLTAKTKGKGQKKAKTETIGTATFSIPASKTVTIKLALAAAGKALLKAAHGHLSAELTIAKSSPSPSSRQTESVHLSQQKATKAKKSKKSKK